MSVTSFPCVRLDSVTTVATDAEITIHDPEAGHFHVLNGPASSVWSLCDGRHSMEQIATRAELAMDLVELAVSEFADLGLLVGGSEVRRVNRRQVIARVVAAGLAVATLPSIGSITGADVAAAASDICQLDVCSSPSCPGFCASCSGKSLDFCATCPHDAAWCSDCDSAPGYCNDCPNDVNFCNQCTGSGDYCTLCLDHPDFCNECTDHPDFCTLCPTSTPGFCLVCARVERFCGVCASC